MGNNKLKDFIYLGSAQKANTAGLAIVMRIPFLVLVNIFPSHFLYPVFFFITDYLIGITCDYFF